MKYILSYKLFENIDPEIWYHGTDETFTEFNEPDERTRPAAKLGIWFSNDSEFTELFGSKIIKAKLTFINPYKISLEEWNDMRSDHHDDPIYFSNLRNKLIEQGYDSFFVNGQEDTLGGAKVSTPDVIAVFYKSQIKIIQ
jgi:hypothetical protein